MWGQLGQSQQSNRGPSIWSVFSKRVTAAPIIKEALMKGGTVSLARGEVPQSLGAVGCGQPSQLTEDKGPCPRCVWAMGRGGASTPPRGLGAAEAVVTQSSLEGEILQRRFFT